MCFRRRATVSQPRSRTAGAATATAVAIQEGLAASGSPLRVRIGLNTGETDERGGDYFGTTLNRAGRLRDIAHGGQVLCAELTAATAVGGGSRGRPARSRRASSRDLSRPERVWQVGRSQSFPPLRSGLNLPGHLPTQVTEFVGREPELRSIHEAVEAARIVTLTGVGGAGKTRLALQFAGKARPRFRHRRVVVRSRALDVAGRSRTTGRGRCAGQTRR